MDKCVPDLVAAVLGIESGMTLMVGGFGGSGAPIELIHAQIAWRAAQALRTVPMSRITGTAALELSLSGKRCALATMCIGVGQGIAIALERVWRAASGGTVTEYIVNLDGLPRQVPNPS